MEIITKTEGNKATMEISGWLNTQTAPQLGDAPASRDRRRASERNRGNAVADR